MNSCLKWSLVWGIALGVTIAVPTRALEPPIIVAQFNSQSAPQAEADRLSQQGLEQYLSGQIPAALQALNQALTLYQENGNRSGEAEVLETLGNVYSAIGDYPRALTAFEQSLAIAQANRTQPNATQDLREIEFGALNGLGTLYREAGDFPQAIDYYQQGLSIVRTLIETDGPEAELRSSEAGFLNNLGVIYRLQGNYPAAIAAHQDSLDIARELGDRSGIASSLNNLGIIEAEQGDLERALDYLQQSLAIDQELGDIASEVKALNNISIVYSTLGDYLAALDTLEQGLALVRQLGNRAGEAVLLGNIGEVYRNIGNFAQAVRYFDESLALKQAVGDRYGEAITLGSIGIVYDDSGEYATALDHYQRSLAISQDIGDTVGEARAIANIGVIYDKLGDYDQALAYYEQGLAMQRQLGNRIVEANTLTNIGNVNRFQGNLSAALDYYQQSLALSQETGELAETAETIRNMGFVYLELNQLPTAETRFLEAMAMLEASWNTELADADKISLLETQIATLEGLEQTYILQEKPSTALEISEKGRARAFVELINERGRLPSAPSDLSFDFDFADIQQVARQTQSVLVEYSLVVSPPEGPAIYIWVVQPDGQLEFRQVSLADEGLNELLELVVSNREGIGGRQRDTGFVVANQPASDQQLRRLHELLVDPIADLLPTNPDQRVVIIPQGELFLVPFAALTDGDRYLIERHTLLTAPSAQVLDLSYQLGQTLAGAPGLDGADVLLVGNPAMPTVWNPQTLQREPLSDLPGAEREARAIATFFDTTALLGTEATETIVKARIGTARVVHLATHGLLEYGDPEDSGILDVPGAIALTPDNTNDGLLTAAEILADLELNAELVILSACDTGLGDITGDGVVGLSRALIAAGAPSVIVSLWSVPDAPTADLMTEFYDQMRQGQDKAQALRQAMLTTMETHPNPRDWAAFTLIGVAD